MERPAGMLRPAHTLASALLAVTLLGGCSLLSGSAPVATQVAAPNVTGLAHAGPTCPVVQPGQAGCEDRPVAGAVLIVQAADGSKVGQVVTRADGRFQLTLPAGRYTLVPQPVQGLMGTGRPVPFEVQDGRPTTVDVSYDTGIR